jgi:hypothetical protein
VGCHRSGVGGRPRVTQLGGRRSLDVDPAALFEYRHRGTFAIR